MKNFNTEISSLLASAGLVAYLEYLPIFNWAMDHITGTREAKDLAFNELVNLAASEFGRHLANAAKEGSLANVKVSKANKDSLRSISFSKLKTKDRTSDGLLIIALCNKVNELREEGFTLTIDWETSPLAGRIDKLSMFALGEQVHPDNKEAFKKALSEFTQQNAEKVEETLKA